MSKSGYSYGPDEFDLPVQPGVPVGVHRTPRSGWRKTWPFLLVMVIFAGIAFGGFYFYLNRSGGTTPTAQTSTAAVDPGAQGAPTEGGVDEGDGAVAEPTPEATPTPEPSPTYQGTVTKGAKVRVLNGAGVQGLAAKGKDALAAQGYTAVTADDFKGNKPAANMVYYKTPDMEATAMDIATHLGIPLDKDHVQLVPENQAQISVILVSDFQG